MTEITHYQPTAELALPAVDNTGTALIMRAVEQMAGAGQLAQALATTAFVPSHFRGKPDDVAAAIMYGAAVGLDPMSSLRAIYVVGGNPGMYARQMVALIQSAGHSVWTEESTDEAVTVAGQRRGSEHVERVTWTIERATKAGYVPTIDPKTGKYKVNEKGRLIGNEKYLTDPQAMLWARAASDVARRVAPDALAGLDTSVEELQVIDAVDVTPAAPARPRRESAADLLATPEPIPAAVVETPAPAEPEQAAEPQLLMATQKQLTAIRAGLGERGIKDRAEVLNTVADMVGRPLGSSKELTRTEAGMVIDTLAEPVETDDAEPAQADAWDTTQPN